MESLRQLSRRINTLIVLSISVVCLLVAVTWGGLGSHTPVRPDLEARFDQAAELLAYGLPHQAEPVIESLLENEPLSARSLKLRRVFAEVLMDDLSDWDRALTHLLFLRQHEPAIASTTEAGIARCLARSGRTRAAQRRLDLLAGHNPLRREMASNSVVVIGANDAVTLDDVRQQVAQLPAAQRQNPEILDKVVNAMMGEKLLVRAARRVGLERDPEFLAKLHEFERNSLVQLYVERELSKNAKVDPTAVELYLKAHAAEFSGPPQIEYRRYVDADESTAAARAAGQVPASGPVQTPPVVTATPDTLPAPLARIDWAKDAPTGRLGPVHEADGWVVYEIVRVVPGKPVPADQAREHAVRAVQLETQNRVLREHIEKLSREEGVTVRHDALRALLPASATAAPRSSAGTDRSAGGAVGTTR